MKPFIFISLLLLLGICSCNSGNGSYTMSRASGGLYEVIVVMDKATWDGAAGHAVQEELSSPVRYLLQEESSMKYSYIRPDQFKGYYKLMRNILFVNIDKSIYTKVSLLNEKDKWATGQAIAQLTAPDEQSLISYLEENPYTVVDFFNKEELARTAEYLRHNYSPVVMEQVKEQFGIALYAPSDIAKSKVGDDCVWFTNDANTGRMDLLIYSFPYTDEQTFTLDYLVARRDSVAK